MRTKTRKPREKTVGVRVTALELKAISDAAKEDGLTVAGWMRHKSMQAVWEWKHRTRKGAS